MVKMKTVEFPFIVQVQFCETLIFILPLSLSLSLCNSSNQINKSVFFKLKVKKIKHVLNRLLDNFT